MRDASLPDNIAAIFSKVYDEDVWRRKNTSGPGSSVEHTKEYRVFLERLLQRYEVKRMLDVGCGIWEHMQCVNLEGVEYLGIDPVSSVIERNKALCLPSNIRFRCGTVDIIENPGDYDMAVVKDVLQHLPNRLIAETLEKLKAVPILVVTNDLHTAPNTDCPIGGFRRLDLERSPFFVRPIDKIDFLSMPFVKRTLVIQNDVNAFEPV